MPYSALWEGVVLPASSLTTWAGAKWLLRSRSVAQGHFCCGRTGLGCCQGATQGTFRRGPPPQYTPCGGGGCGTTTAGRPFRLRRGTGRG